MVRHSTDSILCAVSCCAAGLAGFDLPLVYISKDKLNQPIFGCNNLAGELTLRRSWGVVGGLAGGQVEV
jgi:hypothetical protein